MAIKARLLVDGEFYNLKSFNYGFKNGANSNGFSSNKTRQNGLTCVIEAIRQEYFEEWAMEDRMKKYIEVHISHGVDGMGRTRVLKCHDTFLLELYTRFSSTSNEPISFELFMKSGAIEASWSTAAHLEEWGSLPTNDGEVTVLEEEEVLVFDEQIKVVDNNGKPIGDLSYCVEYEGEIIDSGRTDNNGLTSRIEQKEYKNNYSFYWGDEALIKIENR